MRSARLLGVAAAGLLAAAVFAWSAGQRGAAAFYLLACVGLATASIVERRRLRRRRR